jgi:hypothetical protein
MRSVYLHEAGWCIAAIDLAAGISGSTRIQASKMLTRPHMQSNPEVQQLLSHMHNLAGRGQKPVAVVTQKEALKLLWYCPQSYTVNVFDYVYQQFMLINAGDQTLHAEINHTQ